MLEPVLDAKPHKLFETWIKLSMERMKSLHIRRFVGISVVNDFKTQQDVEDSPRSYAKSM